MADIVVRLLRDGSSEGEPALKVLLKDSIDTVGAEAVFLRLIESLCSAVSAGRASAKGAVLLALARHPERYYRDLSSHSCLQLVDCHTDPLGWDLSSPIPEASTVTSADSDASQKGPETSKASGLEGTKQLPVPRAEPVLSCGPPVRVQMDEMRSAVIKAGAECAKEGRFVVIIDSVSALLRYLPTTSVMAFLDSLRTNARVSSILARVHADLHDARTVASLEYLSTAVVSAEPAPATSASPPATSAGRLGVRHKRRNGKVRELVEEYRIDEDGQVAFIRVPGSGQAGRARLVAPASGAAATKFQVSFNLQLSDAERAEKARVVLPYEHQGDGRELKIYDGRPGLARGTSDGSRRNLSAEQSHARLEGVSSLVGSMSLAMASTSGGEERLSSSGKGDAARVPSGTRGVLEGVVSGGEIHYVRDSDEDADSDEDLDDDLDI